MPRSAGTSVEQNFVNGLITEATALNFPENACTDASNVVFKETGEVTRRLAYDYESAYQLNSVSINTSDAIVEYEWASASSDGDITFVVQQIGSTIRFYRAKTDDSLSHGLHATTISLNTYKVTGAPSVSTEPVGFSSGKGYLFVTHPYCNPFYVSYTPATNILTATVITIQARDFEGVDDDLLPDERPTSLSDAHEYNLCNQGWADNVKCAGSGVTNPITFTNSAAGFYPPNSWQWWFFKNTSFDYDPSNKYSEFPGNSLAPRGHFILDWFATDRSHAVTIPAGKIGTVTERSSGYFRPKTCAFFAGRVWYAGVDSAGYGNEIYYSQIIERDDQLGLCYQQNDPTSENLSDLLDTDGGIARILDIGSVTKLFATQKALLVFASNGVWSISGSDLTAFKATDYTVTKISSVPVLSSLTFVDVLGTPLFWTEDGLWTVAYDNGAFQVVTISDKKIKQYLKNIPRDSKLYAKGAFNRTDKIVQWVFNSTTATNNYVYDSILNLNTITGAFYPWTIYSASLRVQGVISCQGPQYGVYDTVVDGSGNTVIDASGNTVITFSTSDSSSFKYFTTKNVSGTTYNSTYSLCGNTTYLDWAANSSENYNYSSYFISGYRVHGDANKEYQANYVTFIMTNATNSSAWMQGIWDFTSSPSSGKWTTAQQIYNASPTNYRNYRIRRVKVRGWGKALQFKIYSESGKPFNAVGWSSFETVNSVP